MLRLKLDGLESEHNNPEGSQYHRYCELRRRKLDLMRSYEYFRNQSNYARHCQQREYRKREVSSARLEHLRQLHKQDDGDHQRQQISTMPAIEGDDISLILMKRRCQTASRCERKQQRANSRANSIKIEKTFYDGTHTHYQEYRKSRNKEQAEDKLQLANTVRLHKMSLARIKEKLHNDYKTKVQRALRNKIAYQAQQCSQIEAKLRLSRSESMLRKQV